MSLMGSWSTSIAARRFLALAATRIIASGARPDPSALADEDVDVRRLVALS
jgi:hypothetical protein